MEQYSRLVRSLRKKSGQAVTKKYLYADFFQLLLKITEKDETESRTCGDPKNESTETQEEEETETVVQQMDEASTLSRDVGTLQHRRRKKNKVIDEIDRKILKSLEKIEPDEDETFFISVLPSVRRFSADDKLDFGMIVLKTIKDTKTRSGYVSSSFRRKHLLQTVRMTQADCLTLLTVSWLQTPETF